MGAPPRGFPILTAGSSLLSTSWSAAVRCAPPHPPVPQFHPCDVSTCSAAGCGVGGGGVPPIAPFAGAQPPPSTALGGSHSAPMPRSPHVLEWGGGGRSASPNSSRGSANPGTAPGPSHWGLKGGGGVWGDSSPHSPPPGREKPRLRCAVPQHEARADLHQGAGGLRAREVLRAGGSGGGGHTPWGPPPPFFHASSPPPTSPRAAIEESYAKAMVKLSKMATNGTQLG